MNYKTSIQSIFLFFLSVAMGPLKQIRKLSTDRKRFFFCVCVCVCVCVFFMGDYLFRPDWWWGPPPSTSEVLVRGYKWASPESPCTFKSFYWIMEDWEQKSVTTKLNRRFLSNHSMIPQMHAVTWIFDAIISLRPNTVCEKWRPWYVGLSLRKMKAIISLRPNTVFRLIIS